VCDFAGAVVAGDVRRARGGGASLRQLLQPFVLQGCERRRARENCSGFAPRELA
jgi:hypothetical protein